MRILKSTKEVTIGDRRWRWRWRRRRTNDINTVVIWISCCFNYNKWPCFIYFFFFRIFATKKKKTKYSHSILFGQHAFPCRRHTMAAAICFSAYIFCFKWTKLWCFSAFIKSFGCVHVFITQTMCNGHEPSGTTRAISAIKCRWWVYPGRCSYRADLVHEILGERWPVMYVSRKKKTEINLCDSVHKFICKLLRFY